MVDGLSERADRPSAAVAEGRAAIPLSSMRFGRSDRAVTGSGLDYGVKARGENPDLGSPDIRVVTSGRPRHRFPTSLRPLPGLYVFRSLSSYRRGRSACLVEPR